MSKIKGPSPQELAESLSQAPDSVTADLGLSMLIAHKVLAWFAVIPGVLGLRSRYGERYLTPDTVFFSWLLVAVGGGGAAFADVFGARMQPYLGQADASHGMAAAIGSLFFLLYSVMVTLRLGGVFRRRIRDDFSVHSYSDGNPWRLWYVVSRIVPWAMRDGFVRCAVEPFIIFAAGWAITNFTTSRPLGFLAFLCGLSFFIQQVILQQELRAKLLDVADAELEAVELRADRRRILEGSIEAAGVPAPPRARSGLSSLDLARLHAARAAAQRKSDALSALAHSAETPAPARTPAE